MVIKNQIIIILVAKKKKFTSQVLKRQFCSLELSFPSCSTSSFTNSFPSKPSLQGRTRGADQWIYFWRIKCSIQTRSHGNTNTEVWEYKQGNIINIFLPKIKGFIGFRNPVPRTSEFLSTVLCNYFENKTKKSIIQYFKQKVVLQSIITR